MDRIYNPELDADPREFIDGDPEAGVLATALAIKWLNDVQEEICALIEEGGGTLNPTSRTQLRDKILKLVGNANATSLSGLPLDLTEANNGDVLQVVGEGEERQVVPVPALSSASVQVDIFTASGTWTKPDNAESIHIFVMGAGGGGASGYVGADTSYVNGGGGGSGGAAVDHLVEAGALSDSMAIIVGKGGSGGVSSSTSSHNPGKDGGDTLVHWGGEPYLARGGIGATSSGGGNAMTGFHDSGAGGSSGNMGGASPGGAGGGGSGGGKITSGTIHAGANSRLPLRYGESSTLSTGGPAGNDSNNPDAIDYMDIPSGSLYRYPGVPGGGGGAGYASSGGRGGHAGPGGGGGGGGAAITGYQSGAGGDGGDGIVVITTWMS
ncbi:glycine-rich domain-containing protein [Aeromonas hydrophila]|uniref:glycine-rich domain-containing protein n=1 Tax=Aeromonas hydrophila TaxID=644 RepID=UPI000B1D6E8B|nr:hypothetical protein [Aeromonas hydrophila]